MAKQDARQKVQEALEALCAEETKGGFFISWYSARRVAERAGCSEGTALRHLNALSVYSTFHRRRVQGVWAFRHEPYR